MRKGWIYNKKTGSWKKEHQSKISDKKLVYDPKTGFAKGSSKKKTKSKELSPEDRDYVVEELRRRENKKYSEEKVPDYVPEEKTWKKDEGKKDGGDDPPIWFMIIGFVVIGVIFFSVLNAIDKADPIDKAKGFFDDRSDKKEMCAERAEDASNSYAAKKIYKACMSN